MEQESSDFLTAPASHGAVEGPAHVGAWAEAERLAPH